MPQLTEPERKELRRRIDVAKRIALKHAPKELSRAQKQQLALARCIAINSCLSKYPGSTCRYPAKPGSKFCGRHGGGK